MPVSFGLFDFASPPRTASRWIQHAACLAGLTQHGSGVHFPHADVAANTIRVTCVRKPCSWMASYHASIFPGVIGVDCVDAFRTPSDHDDSFDMFVRHYLRCLPGGVGRMFQQYHADICLRVEDLPWAFIDLLKSLGVPKMLRERCFFSGPINISKEQPLWSPSLRARVLDMESVFLDQMEY